MSWADNAAPALKHRHQESSPSCHQSHKLKSPDQSRLSIPELKQRNPDQGRSLGPRNEQGWEREAVVGAGRGGGTLHAHFLAEDNRPAELISLSVFLAAAEARQPSSQCVLKPPPARMRHC